MRLVKRLLLGTVVAAFFTAATIPDVHAVTLRIGGSGSGLGVMRILGEAFENSHPGVRVKVVPSLGSAGGIKALLQGALDISVSGRPLQDSEKVKGAVAHGLLRSPFIIIVHKDVTTKDLDIQELEKIYLGRKATWSDGTRIRLVLRPKTDTVTKLARDISPGMNRAVTVAMSSDGMVRQITDQESVAFVERSPGALAFATLTQILSENRQVRIISISGINPGVKGVANPSYPFFAPLYLVTGPGISPAAREFADFVRSRQGGRILMKYGNLLIKEQKK